MMNSDICIVEDILYLSERRLSECIIELQKDKFSMIRETCVIANLQRILKDLQEAHERLNKIPHKTTNDD